MATVFWVGSAPVVAKVMTATPANVETGDIFSLLVGGVVMATYTATAPTVGNVTDGLTTAWNASTHPWATGITATDTGTEITLTADVAGTPFVVTATAVNGAAADTQTLTMATTVANSGPNEWGEATNWSTQAVPVNGDDVVIADNAISICWGLDQSAVTLKSLMVRQSYTGRIGLDFMRFATTADGETTVGTAYEYRDCYLKIGVQATAANEQVTLGETRGVLAETGSQRICLDLGAVAARVVVHNTAAASADAGRPAIRLACNHADTVVEVRGGVAGVGIADEAPGIPSVLNAIYLTDITTTTTTSSPAKVVVSSQTTITRFFQQGGVAKLAAAADVTDVTAVAGTLTLDGDYTITTLVNRGATIYAHHDKTGAAAVTTAWLYGGTTETRFNHRPRTWTTVKVDKNNATFNRNPDVLTITNQETL